MDNRYAELGPCEAFFTAKDADEIRLGETESATTVISESGISEIKLRDLAPADAEGSLRLLAKSEDGRSIEYLVPNVRFENGTVFVVR